jgi:hypothetical protein
MNNDSANMQRLPVGDREAMQVGTLTMRGGMVDHDGECQQTISTFSVVTYLNLKRVKPV